MQDKEKKQQPTMGLVEFPADPKAFRESVLGVHPLEKAAREAGISLDDAIAIVKKRKDLRDHEMEFLNSITVQGFVTAIEQLHLTATMALSTSDRVEASKALITAYLKLKEYEKRDSIPGKDPLSRAMAEASLWSFTAMK